MKQLTQKLKNGSMQILEVSPPQMLPGHLLIRPYYSLVSAGTEGSTVKTARKGFIGKAKERPQQVKQVLDTFKSQGPLQTYRTVMKKLDAYSPLGYSCSGQVIEVQSSKLKAQSIKVGDPVACGGLNASHAEIVSVPENLCVRLEKDADLKQAAYNTLGAIAMQGVRQADLRIGETCAVIGLGLLGQLTCLILRASGVRVVGVDIDQAMVAIGKKHCLDLPLNRNQSGIQSGIQHFTAGIGCDAVIITAASNSLDPINFAGAISRKRGTIVVVGAVPTGFEREPHFYKKELQVRMSCSYGPGRYDPVYEEKGIDYPAAYVRWTEKRNMQAFQELIYSGKIEVSYLTTHTFKLEDAPKAYDMMMEKSEPFIGILIEYDVAKKIENRPVFLGSKLKAESSKAAGIGIGFIGTGSYAQSHLLPNIPRSDNVSLKGVLTSSGTSSRSVGERFGFDFCAGSETDIFENEIINTVFIATRHDSHAGYVLKALNAEKNVFVEKPLCLTVQELDDIAELLAQSSKVKAERILMMVGYNRRFSPLAAKIKEKMPDGPAAMTYRINAGAIPSGSWIQDVEFGGGRIIGEVCHFVDFLIFMAGALPLSVHACAVPDPEHHNDTLAVNLTFENGSIGNICYIANGDKSLPKERVEIHKHGCSAVLNDFKQLHLHVNGKKKTTKIMSQDKGQKAEVEAFVDAVRNGGDAPIPFEELYLSSLTTFKIIESIRTGQALKIFDSDPAKNKDNVSQAD